MVNMYTNCISHQSLVDKNLQTHIPPLLLRILYMSDLEERKIKLHIKYGKSYH